eukprot:g31101.t1
MSKVRCASKEASLHKEAGIVDSLFARRRDTESLASEGSKTSAAGAAAAATVVPDLAEQDGLADTLFARPKNRNMPLGHLDRDLNVSLDISQVWSKAGLLDLSALSVPRAATRKIQNAFLNDGNLRT